MDKAFSLLSNRIIPAEAISYRENIGKQIICHVCGEPVFKKEMRVEARDEKTHFLSHYVGDPTTCKERAKQSNKNLNDKEKKAQLQHLSKFNNVFREQILKSFQKNGTKKNFDRNRNNFEIAEQIAINDLKIGTIRKIVNATSNYVNEKLEIRFGNEFNKLDETLSNICKHLNSQFGKENLRYLACIAVIKTYQNTYLPIGEMLKQKNINNQAFFLENLYIATKLLLISYINWPGSIEKIEGYINKKKIKLVEPLLNAHQKKGVVQKQQSKPVSKICIGCKKVVAKNYLKCPYCYCNLKDESVIERQLRISKKVIKSSPKKKPVIKSFKSEPVGIEEAKFCEVCGKYSYTGSLTCPACLRRYRNSISTKPNVVTPLPTTLSYPKSRKFKSGSGWLESQPWDEENIKAHQKIKSSR